MQPIRFPGLAVFILGVSALQIVGSTSFAAPVPARPDDQAKKDPGKPDNKGKTTSMTGCMDEQNGRYVLDDDRRISRIADLEPDGFPVESFAKHVGQKVTVRGVQSAGDSVPLFRVRAVEKVSDTCAPQPAGQRKQ